MADDAVGGFAALGMARAAVRQLDGLAPDFSSVEEALARLNGVDPAESLDAWRAGWTATAALRLRIDATRDAAGWWLRSVPDDDAASAAELEAELEDLTAAAMHRWRSLADELADAGKRLAAGRPQRTTPTPPEDLAAPPSRTTVTPAAATTPPPARAVGVAVPIRPPDRVRIEVGTPAPSAAVAASNPSAARLAPIRAEPTRPVPNPSAAIGAAPAPAPQAAAPATTPRPRPSAAPTAPPGARPPAAPTAAPGVRPATTPAMAPQPRPPTRPQPRAAVSPAVAPPAPRMPTPDRPTPAARPAAPPAVVPPAPRTAPEPVARRAPEPSAPARGRGIGALLGAIALALAGALMLGTAAMLSSQPQDGGSQPSDAGATATPAGAASASPDATVGGDSPTGLAGGPGSVLTVDAHAIGPLDPDELPISYVTGAPEVVALPSAFDRSIRLAGESGFCLRLPGSTSAAGQPFSFDVHLADAGSGGALSFGLPSVAPAPAVGLRLDLAELEGLDRAPWYSLTVRVEGEAGDLAVTPVDGGPALLETQLASDTTAAPPGEERCLRAALASADGAILLDRLRTEP